MLQVVAARNYEDMSRKAANIISAQIVLKEDSILGLATGSTPLGIYRILGERCGKGDLDFSKVRSVNLDEYQGLDPQNSQSYRYFMNKNFFDHININQNETYLPDGTNLNPQEECARYHRKIESMGRIDLQLLGIGNNGHIGFNEPSEFFLENTHCVELTKSTIEANARFFKDKKDVPRYAYTMGIGEIMSARRILLVASGKTKAPIIKKMLQESVTPYIPASILKFHDNAILIADEDALSLCS